jgi:diacylglycerol kinase family enzyme
MAMPSPDPDAPAIIATARAVVNAASGSVGPNAETRLRAVLDQAGLDAEVVATPPGGLRDALTAAVEAKPDLLVVLAGDGTANLAAKLCGSDGPLLAPLPGGTMNMLPRAIYGARPWPEALQAALDARRVAAISCGEVGAHSFYVAAILGEPALWADAREAVRQGKPRLALLRARRAMLRAFAGRLRYRLDEGRECKTRALTLMCPLASRAMQADDGLEAASLNPHDAAEAFRLGFATLTGRWRDDPAVTSQVSRAGVAWAKGRIPMVLDGEPHRMDAPVQFRFRPKAVRVLAPADFQPLPVRLAA